MMCKSIFLFIMNTLAIFVAMSLLPTPVFSDDSEIETGYSRYTVQLVSEECEYSPDQTWHADKIPHFIINHENCGGPCTSVPCTHEGQLKADHLNLDWIINDVGPLWSLDPNNTEEGRLKIETTFIDTNVICDGQSVVRLSQVLTPSAYYIGGETQFSVITETVMLEPLPTHTPTPIPASIEGYVWQDVNEDGIRDEDEPGVADVDIRLVGVCNFYQDLSERLRMAASLRVKSDSQGFYQFTNADWLRYNSDIDRGFLLYSDWYLDSDPYIYTEANQGTDEMRDSDVTCMDDPSWPNGICITDQFDRPITGTLRGIDAGIIMIPSETPTPIATPTLSPTRTPTLTRVLTRVVPRDTATPVPEAKPSPTLTSDIDIYLPIIAQ